jgi:hypothetical protein
MPHKPHILDRHFHIRGDYFRESFRIIVFIKLIDLVFQQLFVQRRKIISLDI